MVSEPECPLMEPGLEGAAWWWVPGGWALWPRGIAPRSKVMLAYWLVTCRRRPEGSGALWRAAAERCLGSPLEVGWETHVPWEVLRTRSSNRRPRGGPGTCWETMSVGWPGNTLGLPQTSWISGQGEVNRGFSRLGCRPCKPTPHFSSPSHFGKYVGSPCCECLFCVLWHHGCKCPLKHFWTSFWKVFCKYFFLKLIKLSKTDIIKPFTRYYKFRWFYINKI